MVVWYAGCRPIFLLLPVWLGIRMGLNAVDGMLARELGQQSRLGAYLNEICDVVCRWATPRPGCCPRSRTKARPGYPTWPRSTTARNRR